MSSEDNEAAAGELQRPPSPPSPPSPSFRHQTIEKHPLHARLSRNVACTACRRRKRKVRYLGGARGRAALPCERRTASRWTVVLCLRAGTWANEVNSAMVYNPLARDASAWERSAPSPQVPPRTNRVSTYSALPPSLFRAERLTPCQAQFRSANAVEAVTTVRKPPPRTSATSISS